ncbi:phage tail protein [Pseudomonas corrugata]|uniref:phage tail protein n=1 Tax=Pseudomonas corrugata TaxID=47879 RepID=UPI0022318B17|nr:phage tail protein [Pseudomonas corrugata]UZD97404.1 phage tail protein [Pseudomonas corrugata]
MVDKNTIFGGMLTTLGANKKTNCDALGIPWEPKYMLVGDANGTDPVPSPSQTKLINQVYRAQLNQLRVSEKDPNVLIAELVLPPEVGGWWIRELGLEDKDGVFCAVSNVAPSYKPLLEQNSGRNQVVRMHIITNGTSNIQLKIDPSVVLATREYVDSQIQAELYKFDSKQSVRAATTANIALAGPQTIDGVTLLAGDRVLVKNQVAGKDNGIYLVTLSGSWVRAADADTSLEVTPGLFVHVEQGTANADSCWQLATDAPIILGVTDLVFEMLVGRTGVVAGNYRSVTVDKMGRVIGGTNPTSLPGFGIEVASQAEAVAGTDDIKAMTPLRVTQALMGKVASQAEVTEGSGDTVFVTPRKLRNAQATLVEAQAATNDTKIMTPLRVFQAFTKFIGQATESVSGWAKVATQAQVDSGVGDETFVTPSKLRLGFQGVLAQNGYIVFPSWMLGLMLQWGRYPGGAHLVNVSFPIAFTSQTFFVIVGANDDNDSVSANSYSLTSFNATQLDGATGTNVSTPFFWLAFGK